MTWHKTLTGRFKKTKGLSFSREELNRVLECPDYTPKDLVALFEKDFRKEFAADICVSQKYTLKEHTLMVMGQFEKYFSNKKLPAGIETNFFRVILVLHDIGAPEAIREGVKHGQPCREAKQQQHKYTMGIFGPVLSDLGFSTPDINIALALISKDLIGKYIRYGGGEKTTEIIKKGAEEARLPSDVFLDLLLIFYMVDAGSYTVDAGGPKALDRLFIFDKKKKEMKFSSGTADKIEQLEKSVRGIQGGMWLRDHNWHDLAYDDLADWVKNKKERLDSGEMLRGATFRYKLNLNTSKYQVRLRSSIKEALYCWH